MSSTNPQRPAPRYPTTPAQPVTDTCHGVEITDSYRWLEDEQDPAVQTWVQRQNECTDEWFGSVDIDTLYRELEADMDTFVLGTPWRRGDHYFWYERRPGQHHSVLFAATEPGSDNKREVFDVNRLSEDGSVSLSWFAVSRQGNYAVYGLQEQGSERDQVYIRDMRNGEDEAFFYGRVFQMSWGRTHEAGFYYMRSNYEAHGGDVSDEVHYQQVYYHRLGDQREDDRLLFDGLDYLPKEAWLEVHASEDEMYALINAAIGFARTKLYMLHLPTGGITELVPGADAVHEGTLLDGYVYLDTDYEANNRRVLRAKVTEAGRPLSEWETFMPEDPEQKLEAWRTTNSQIITEYIHNATSRVYRLDRRSGELLGELDMPPLASLSALATDREQEEFYYAVSTFLAPATKYRFDPQGGASRLYWQDPRALDEAQFTVEQVFYTSADQTRVPMFIVRPAREAGEEPQPALLTGYGGFGIGEYPEFIGSFKPWLERGGLFALPNLRGGDEFGEAWHRAGMLEKKQNVFDDMNAAAQHLIKHDYTQADKLVITGGSNGGLLVGACITQRPELYQAAVCRVPLLDMVRYHRFLMARLWTFEYGDPDEQEAFQWLYAYSPYHSIGADVSYPSLLLTAGMHDSRVHPMHAWKMTAALQTMKPESPVLLRTETKAGHGPGKGFYQALHDHAERLGFMMEQTGMDV